MNLPPVEIIVPARNEQKNLGRCLGALRALRYPQFSITVVDNGSSDHTARVADEAGVKVLTEVVVGRGKARNTGLKASSAEWIAFVDADCVVNSDWLEKLMRTALLMKADVAQGPIVPSAEKTDALFQFRRFRADYRTNGRYSFLPLLGKHSPLLNGAAFLVKRSALLEIDGFDESLPRHQDVDLGKRLYFQGRDFAFAPEASAEVFFTKGWTSYLLRSFEVGRYKERFNAKWKARKPQPSALLTSLKRYAHEYRRTANFNYALMMLDESLIFLGEYLAPETKSKEARSVVPRPAFIVLENEVAFFHSQDAKWLKLDWVSGHVLRMMFSRIAMDDLYLILDTKDIDLDAYQSRLKEIFNGSLK